MIKNAIKEYLIITFGAILAGAAIFFFMLPSHVAVGSGTALAMVLANFIPLPVSAITLILNICLLVLGFILVGPEFGAKTVYAAIMVPVSMGVFENIFRNENMYKEDTYTLDGEQKNIRIIGRGSAVLDGGNPNRSEETRLNSSHLRASRMPSSA